MQPKSLLSSASAALKCYFDAIKRPPINDDVRHLIQGMIKSGTVAPIIWSPVMPRQPFVDLFMGWPDNKQLALEKLRMKTIVLMALCLMLRPSDIAPRAVKIEKKSVVKHIFSMDRLTFLQDWSVEVYLAEIKNDYNRDGFRVFMRSSSVAQVCPVDTLRIYPMRTGGMEVSRPVFSPLKYPFDALSSTSIAKIMSDAIQMVSLDKLGFSPKSFRPTGATASVENNIDPDFTRSVGRWMNRETFEKHYVHAQPPADMSDAILLS